MQGGRKCMHLELSPYLWRWFLWGKTTANCFADLKGSKGFFFVRLGLFVYDVWCTLHLENQLMCFQIDVHTQGAHFFSSFEHVYFIDSLQRWDWLLTRSKLLVMSFLTFVFIHFHLRHDKLTCMFLTKDLALARNLCFHAFWGKNVLWRWAEEIRGWISHDPNINSSLGMT